MDWEEMGAVIHEAQDHIKQQSDYIAELEHSVLTLSDKLTRAQNLNSDLFEMYVKATKRLQQYEEAEKVARMQKV